MIPLDEFARAVQRVTGRRSVELDPELRDRWRVHIDEMAEAISTLAKRMSPEAAFDLISCAGSETPEYVAALDVAADSDGYICMRPTVILGVAACYGWENDSEVAGIRNPWVSFLDLVLAGLCISYSWDEEDGEYMILMRVTTDASDDTQVIYRGPGSQRE